jgi:16S rRNA (cytosine1402-N4)-methyltransferase
MQGLPRERKLAAGSNSSVARRHAASPPKCMDALWAEAFYGWGPWTKLASMPAATIHIPVLLEEVLEGLQAAPGGVFVDGTLGGGGHTRALAERVKPAGRVVAVDLDPGAVESTSETLRGLPIDVAAASYVAIPEVLAELGIEAVDGILLDLGLSSDQLADAERGFSFDAEGELDLRFDATQGEPAWRLLERLREQDLADVIYKYGEERFSRRIARKVVERRQQKPIRTAADLAALVRSCVPRGKGDRIDPATRTFQALRIAVNDELANVEKALATLPDCLRPGGRLAVISFHSLEDRIVKQAFREDPRLTVVTRKPVLATDAETAANPRARSAKLRIAERVAPAP